MKVDKQSIKSFILDGVDRAETDKQMAVRLGFGTTTIAHWRKRFNIKPADKFYRKFNEKYDKKGGIERFILMVEEKATLQEIARHFGFSREYARQIYKKLYKKPYGRSYVHKW